MTGNWAPWWHWLSMAAIWIAGITVILWTVIALFPDQPHRDPLQILNERLALGEISLDEYRQRCEALNIHTRPNDRPGA